MGTNTLVSRADGQIITQDWFNDFNQAIRQDWIPRNASNVPTSLAGSIGTASFSWDKIYCQTAIVNGVTLDPSQQALANNRFISFKTVASTDGYPDYLTAGGVSNLNCTLDATGVNFEAVINGTPVTLIADVIFPVTAGFTVNHTALINEPSWTAASSQEQQSLVFGEQSHESVFINFDNAGSNITGLADGSKVFFRGVNSSAQVEFAYGEVYGVSGATYKFRPIWRGVDASGTRRKFRDNDTWTLCKATFLFTDANGVPYTTNIHPISVDTLPSAGTSGLYIYRKSDEMWYLDNGTSVTQVDRIFVGVALSHNATDNSAVVYLPDWNHFSQDFLNLSESDVSLNIGNDPLSTSTGLLINGRVKIGGAIYDDINVRINTATAGDLESGTANISAIGIKYIYKSYSTGKYYFSDTQPRSWKYGVLMHPAKMWRCIGWFLHSASAFYLFTQNGREILLHVADYVSINSWFTTYSNVVVTSGYMPSFVTSLLEVYSPNAVIAYYSATSYSNTSDLLLGVFSFQAALQIIAPVFSGYLRRRTSADTGDNNYLLGYWI